LQIVTKYFVQNMFIPDVRVILTDPIFRVPEVGEQCTTPTKKDIDRQSVGWIFNPIKGCLGPGKEQEKIQ
jgi:hypothetical protein